MQGTKKKKSAAAMRELSEEADVELDDIQFADEEPIQTFREKFDGMSKYAICIRCT